MYVLGIEVLYLVTGENKLDLCIPEFYKTMQGVNVFLLKPFVVVGHATTAS